MGLSETIVAASIGAAATVCAAMFQLFTALRANNKVEVRPKRGSTLRSMFAVAALMAVSAASGYFASELRNRHTAEDMQSMRNELNAKLQVLATTTERLATARDSKQDASVTTHADVVTATQSVSAASVEAMVYAPACTNADCTEAASRPIPLCGAIPAAAQVRKIELFTKRADASVSLPVEFDKDLGGARFSGPPMEYPQGDDRKAVCVNYSHWDQQAHIASTIVHFGAPIELRPADQSKSSQAITQMATQQSTLSGSSVSLTVSAQ